MKLKSRHQTITLRITSRPGTGNIGWWWCANAYKPFMSNIIFRILQSSVMQSDQTSDAFRHHHGPRMPPQFFFSFLFGFCCFWYMGIRLYLPQTRRHRIYFFCFNGPTGPNQAFSVHNFNETKLNNNNNERQNEKKEESVRNRNVHFYLEWMPRPNRTCQNFKHTNFN